MQVLDTNLHNDVPGTRHIERAVLKYGSESPCGIYRQEISLEHVSGDVIAGRRWMLMTARSASIALFCFLLLVSNANVLSATSKAHAKPERGDTVATRMHPELEPLGFSLGSFLIYTKLGYMRSYDDNIFANDGFKESDVISVASPAISVTSNWARHAVNLSASSDFGRYQDFSSEDYNDWQVSGNVRVDASHATRINLGTVYASLHEPRESLDNAGGLFPGLFTSSLVTLGLTYRPGAFSISPIASYNSLKYKDIDSLILGIFPVVIKQDDRNRTESILGLRGDYEVGPYRNVFLRVNSYKTDYDKVQQVTGFDRTSDGYDIATGISLDGGITRGEFFIGYRKQKYINPLPDISAIIFGIDLAWKPSELTTVEFDVKRDFGETTLFIYSGFVSTLASINVDHELRRNIILNANMSKIVNDFDGIGSATREDDLYTATVGIKWHQSRNLAVTLRHEYAKRNTSDSTIAASFSEDNFQRNVSWISIELQQ